MQEPILTPNPDRFVIFPIQHQNIWDLYKKTSKQVWGVEEIDFSKDPDDWEKIDEKERRFLSMILAFFATADGIVMENINVNFAAEVQIPEARQYYAYQSFIEAIHSETYSMMINVLVKDPDERTRLFTAVRSIPSITNLANWAMKWMNPERPFRERILAFVINEGLLFSDKFAGIFWFARRNLFPGVKHANLLIARDEASHESHGLALYGMLLTKVDPKTIIEMVTEAVDVDTAFMVDALPEGVIGMNHQLMTEYVHMVANDLLVKLGCEPYYKVSQDSAVRDMMASNGLDSIVSFFENPNHVYFTLADPKKDKLKFDANFDDL